MRSNLLVVACLLSLSAFSDPATAARPACALTNKQLNDKVDELYRSYQPKLQGNPALLDTCRDIYKGRFGDCDRYEKYRGDCNAAGNAAIEVEKARRPEMHSGFISMAQGLTSTANCAYAISHCYRNGTGHKGETSANDAFDKCSGAAGTAAKTATGVEKNDQTTLKEFSDQLTWGLETSQYKCWRQIGDAAEALAHKTLADAKSALGGAGVIDCIDNNSGNRVCQVSENGTQFKAIEKGEELNGNSPAKLETSKTSCSGTLLGDGLTVMTAGHCTDKLDKDGQPTISVYDKYGTLHKVSATCVRGLYNKDAPLDTVDSSYCRLSSPIAANPVYVATLDPSQKTGCTTVGYLKKCAPDFFQGLSSSPVSMRAWPAQYNEVDFKRSDNTLYQTTGTLYYDSSNHNLFTNNMLCTSGCSGGGYLVDHHGEQVLVSAHSYGYDKFPGGGAHVIPVDLFKDLKIESISTRKLAEGTFLFQSMPLEKAVK